MFEIRPGLSCDLKNDIEDLNNLKETIGTMESSLVAKIVGENVGSTVLGFSNGIDCAEAIEFSDFFEFKDDQVVQINGPEGNITEYRYIKLWRKFIRKYFIVFNTKKSFH